MFEEIITESAGPQTEVQPSGSRDRSEEPASVTVPSSLRGAGFERFVLGAGNAAMQNPMDENLASGREAPPAAPLAGANDSIQQSNDEAEANGWWNQTLRSLGVLTPAEVDRLCAAETSTRFLVEGLLPVKSIAIAGGESTIGKSPLICQLALCVAAGVPFLGMPTRKSRVLYHDLENSLSDCQAMRNSLVKHLALGRAPDNFLLATDPPSNLETLVAAVEPKLVIVDSLRAFRPDVTDKNAFAGEWLKEIRRLTRAYGCTFLIVHHLRKPNQAVMPSRLEDCKAADWLQQMEGPRAWVNQTDVRIAIAEGDLSPVALKLKWSRRVYGDSPLVSVQRILDDVDDEPLGYRQLTGVEHLSPERRTAFEKLGPEFTTGEAKAALDRSDDPTNKFLEECKQLGLVEKVARGQWRKVLGSLR